MKPINVTARVVLTADQDCEPEEVFDTFVQELEGMGFEVDEATIQVYINHAAIDKESEPDSGNEQQA